MKKFDQRYMKLKYFEANSPTALVAHRIEPLHGTMRALTKKRNRSDDGVQQQVPDDVEVQERSQSYKSMLHNQMGMIQDYLLLSDNDRERGAQKTLELVGSTAQLRTDNRICIWLEDVWSER